jgi:hypothetical protein
MEILIIKKWKIIILNILRKINNINKIKIMKKNTIILIIMILFFILVENWKYLKLANKLMHKLLTAIIIHKIISIKILILIISILITLIIIF